MPDKILVAYASRGGSTAGVAEAIGKTLLDKGLEVDVREMADVSDVTPYTAVIAGSAIQGQRWLPEAMRFLRENRTALQVRPFAAFLVCITMSMKNADHYRDGVAQWLGPVRELVKPVSEGLFAGVLDVSKVPSFGDRLKFRLTVVSGVWSEGDHRDWEEIRTWTDRTASLLRQRDAQMPVSVAGVLGRG